MRKKAQIKKKKRYSKKIGFIISMLTIGICISYKRLSISNIKIKNNPLITYLSTHTISNKSDIIKTVFNHVLEESNPVQIIHQEYKKYLPKVEKNIKKESNPIIYLYNTHQSEEYYPSDYIEFSINPTVIMNNYILKDIFDKHSLPTIVEESSIDTILKQNNWKYANSYKASRLLMEKAKKDYPTLEYFIDIHRDSIKKEKTTVEIDNKSYAKILFIVGLENSTFQENLDFTEKINQKITEKYPTLSRGIYKKEGPGVNGIYNQDFSSHTILIEVGGYENTTVEVLNSLLAFSECFMEVINE